MTGSQEALALLQRADKGHRRYTFAELMMRCLAWGPSRISKVQNSGIVGVEWGNHDMGIITIVLYMESQESRNMIWNFEMLNNKIWESELTIQEYPKDPKVVFQWI
jgi:hypothetical protein